MDGPTILLCATSAEGGNVTAWDVHTGTALTSFKANASPPGGLARLGRDYLVAAQLGRGGGLHFWAWHKDQVHQRCFAAEPLTAVAATADGLYCAAGGASGAAFLWEASSGRLLRTWPAHYKAITCLAFSDCGSILVTGGEDTLVNAWLLADVVDATAGQALQMGGPLLQPLRSWADHTLPVTCLAVGAGGAGAVVASGSLDRTLKMRSLAGSGSGGGLLRSVPLPSPVHSLALDPGEHAVYAGCASGAIYEVSLVGGPAVGGGGGAGEAADEAAAAAGAAGSCAHPALEGHAQAVSCLAFTPDAAYLLSGSEDQSVRVWELRSRQQVRLLPNPAKGPVTSLLALAQPPFLQIGGSHAASGSSSSGKRGPKRPQPLAPFTKYPNAPGTLKPWEGGLVLLDGAAPAQAAAAGDDWQRQLAVADSWPADAAAPSGTAAALTGVAASGAAGGAGAGAANGAAAAAAGGDVGALQEENRRLREQLDRALATAQQWGHLNTQLQTLVAEQLKS